MRQLFSSPRLENVERVAQLLDEANIENRVFGTPGYKGHSRRQFSYNNRKKPGENTVEPPSVWVINSDDYKPAREILHGIGLLDPDQTSSYLPEPLQHAASAAPKDPQKRLDRIKMILLFMLGAIASLMAIKLYLHH